MFFLHDLFRISFLDISSENGLKGNGNVPTGTRIDFQIMRPHTFQAHYPNSP